MSLRFKICLISITVICITCLMPATVFGKDTVKPTWPTQPPSTLTASNITATSVLLTWTPATDNIGVTKYRVYKNGVLYATLGNVLSCTVMSLTPLTTYTFKVEAGDAANLWSTTGPSTVATTLQTDGVPPTWPPPKWVRTSKVLDTSLTLNWSTAIDRLVIGGEWLPVTHYRIYQNGALIAVTGNVQTYEVTGLTAVTEYQFTIEAEDAVGNIALGYGPTCFTTTSYPMAQYTGHKCFQCHSNPPAAGTSDIYTRLTFGTEDPYANYEILYRHGMVAAEWATAGSKLGCKNCHNPLLNDPLYDPPDSKVVDPDNIAGLFTGTMVNPTGVPAMVRDDVGFCGKCHDNNPPAGVLMGQTLLDTNWGSTGFRNLTNVISTYSLTNTHGSRLSADGGPGFQPGSGYSYNSPPLPCTACHDPHGSSNVFHLRENPGIATGVKITGPGFSVFCSGCHVTTTQAPGQTHNDGQTGGDCWGCHGHNASYPQF